jgi:polyisoprenoid-binding protein YceI
MNAPRALLLAAVLATTAGPASAEEAKATYTFGTYEARTNVTFVSEADLETIHGVTHKVSGSVTYDPATGDATGRLVAPVKELRTGIELRDAHLRGEQGGVWLEAAKHPEIVFELTKTTPVAGTKDQFDYQGRLTIHGVTKDWKGRATIRFIPASVAGPAKLGAGDWARVKTSFDVPIRDFGIVIPEGVGPKVSATWRVSIDLYGTTAPPAPK